MNRTYSKVITAMFIAYMAIFIALNSISPDRAFSEEENRTLQTMPAFSFEKLKSGRFTKDFEAYIADQFFERDLWVGVKSKMETLLGKEENNDVYRGKDGYLFQKFKPDTAMDFKEKISALNTFSAAIPNVNKYFMLVPTSEEILKDKLPPYAPAENQLQYINKVKAGLDKNIKFVNVYDTLLSKKDEYIYYKTDHHWTMDGAYYSYQQFCNEAGIQSEGKADYRINTVTESFLGTSYSKSGFKNVKPDAIRLYTSKAAQKYTVEYSDINNKFSSVYEMKNLDKKDKYSVFFGGNHPLTKISTGVSNGRKILIIKDSYANSFVPLLLSDYSEIYMVDLRYFDDSASELIKKNRIQEVLFLYNAVTFSEDEFISGIY